MTDPAEDLEAEFPQLLSKAYDISVPPGWDKLVRGLCQTLATEYPTVRVVQLKSKFGELRCYVYGSPNAALDLIDEYTRRSRSVCEDCGCLGQSTCHDGWWATLCEGCFGIRGW